MRENQKVRRWDFMPSRYFGIEFNDLSDDKQQELIQEVAESIRENWKDEAEQLIKENKNGEAKEYEGKTWQEIICREYTIDWQLWDDDPEEAKIFDWEYAIEQESEDQAEKKCWRGMHHLEIEVEL